MGSEPDRKVRIGASDIVVNRIGVGTWQWGDERYWGYGRDYGADEVAGAFDAALAEGLDFFDTAEIYAKGESERLLGRQLERTGERVVVASKYMPWPGRLTADAVARAIDGSCERLAVERIDLYQVHWPFSLLRKGVLLRALARAVEAGRIRWIGVSNYGAARMRRAEQVLAAHGVRLVSNQVQYSLLNRGPEVNGVLETCRELDITLIAYSPLAQGLLTGKYGHEAELSEARRFNPKFRRAHRRLVDPVVEMLREIGDEHGKAPAQVALNWLVRKEGVVAIPGVKNAEQVRANAGGTGWAMSEEELRRLDGVTTAWRRRGLLDRLV